MVVLNWQDEISTMKCIDSLLSDTAVSYVIIVDNESTGAMREQLEKSGHAAQFPRIELIELQENRGFAGGVNEGFKCALNHGAEYIGTINNDAVLFKGTFGSLKKVLTDRPKCQLVAPQLRNLDGKIIPSKLWFCPLLGNIKESGNSITRTFPFLTWACVIMRAETFRIRGGVDEAFFMYWEDVYFSMQNAKVQDALEVVGETVVEHRVSSSSGRASWKIDFYSSYGHAVLTRRLGGSAWIGLAIRTALRVSKRLLSGRGSALAATVRGTARGLRASSNREIAWRRLSDVTSRVL